MNPAYHVSLTPAEKRLITDIAAIQSQIEWLMRLTVQHLLQVAPTTAHRIMGSSSLAANSEIWISVVREKHSSANAREWAEYGFGQMSDMSRARNDFLHTLYGFATDGEPQGDTSFLYGHKATKRHMDDPRRAIRVRGSTEAPLKELRTLRERAAYLSLVFAHVEGTASPHQEAPRPWLRRLGTNHPPTNPRQLARSVKVKQGGRQPPGPK